MFFSNYHFYKRGELCIERMKKRLQWVSQIDWVSSKRKTKLLSAGFALILAGIFVFFFIPSDASTASDITADSVVALTNQSRAESGETALAVNVKLSQAAQAKAGDMIANDYFSHTSPAGTTPWNWIEKQNYDYNYAGENLAMDFYSSDKMEEAWMASPTHRANILNDRYREVGVAVKEGVINGHDTILAVVMFGSGDKNLPSASDAKVSSDKNIPLLPSGEARQEALVFQNPVITSPQADEIVSGNEVKISGRAQAGEAVSIYDNGNFIESTAADSKGWFFATEKNLSGGNHKLTLDNGKTDTKFFADRIAPDVDFHLYADATSPQKIFLEAGTNKDNCTFQFGDETRVVAQGARTVFAVDLQKSSMILRVRDEAGNKNFRQVNIANYYSPEKIINISGRLAAFLSAPKAIYAADSGRDALKNNLSLAMGGFNNH